MADVREAEIRTCIHKRGAIKARVTRFTSYLATVGNDNEITQVKLRLEKFKSTWDDFDSIQANLEELDQDNAAQHSQERDGFENTYFAAMAEAERMIQRSAPPVVLPSGREVLPDTTAQVKLPTINLPTFNGAYDQWMTFLDTFQSLIHDNPNITLIQKFHYLRSALSGDAAQVIHSLEISAASYAIAWDLLKERFDNKRIIIQNHIKALFDIPCITRESYQTIRHLLDATSRHLHALKSLEQPIESWDAVIVHLVTSKFDQSTKREWESVTDAKKLPTWADLNKFLQNRCHLLQSLNIATPLLILKPPNHNQYSGGLRHNVKHADSKARSQSYVSASKTTCPTCEQSHLIYHCPEFNSLAVSDRFKEIKRLNLCINCLRTGHRASQCGSGSCRICSRKHNTLLHASGAEGSAQSAETAPKNTSLHVSNGKMQELCHHPESQTDLDVSRGTTLASQHSSAGQGPIPVENRVVVLSTARVIVYDKHGQPHECRALLDSGSQSSFISKELSQRMQLELHPTHIPVSGISQSVTPVSHFVRARIKSRLNNYQAHLSFLVLTAITERLPALRLDRKLLCIPTNLKLADPDFHNPAPIDMLIGAELFWDLLCIGQFKSAVNQAILQKTQLGWVISGGIGITPKQAVSTTTPCFLAVQAEILDFRRNSFSQIPL